LSLAGGLSAIADHHSRAVIGRFSTCLLKKQFVSARQKYAGNRAGFSSLKPAILTAYSAPLSESTNWPAAIIISHGQKGPGNEKTIPHY